MSNRPEFGSRVIASGYAERHNGSQINGSYSESNYAVQYPIHWVSRKFAEPKEGIYIGYRHVQEGFLRVSWGEEAWLDEKRRVEVWLIVTNPRQKPFYVFPESCEAV